MNAKYIHSYKNLLLGTGTKSVYVRIASITKDKVLVENSWYLFVLLGSTKSGRGWNISVSVWKSKGKSRNSFIFMGMCSSSGFATSPAFGAAFPALCCHVWPEIRCLISYKLQHVPHPLLLYGINIIISIINMDGS